MSYPLPSCECNLERKDVCRLQPVKETREKQVDLWTELILRYCRQKRVSCPS